MIDSLVESIAMDTIWSLKEVQSRNENIKLSSNGKRSLSILLYKKPEELDIEAYWIKVVEDNNVSYVTHFNFYVYQNSFNITYLNIIDDREISLGEWRKLITN